MIKLQCDLCGIDTKKQAFNLIITDMDCRYETNTVLEVVKKTFLLCPTCYYKLNLPNIYKKNDKE